MDKARIEITIDENEKRAIEHRAEQLNISLAEYVRRALKDDCKEDSVAEHPSKDWSYEDYMGKHRLDLFVNDEIYQSLQQEATSEQKSVSEIMFFALMHWLFPQSTSDHNVSILQPGTSLDAALEQLLAYQHNALGCVRTCLRYLEKDAEKVQKTIDQGTEMSSKKARNLLDDIYKKHKKY